jgi:hypothetical protein
MKINPIILQILNACIRLSSVKVGLDVVSSSPHLTISIISHTGIIEYRKLRNIHWGILSRGTKFTQNFVKIRPAILWILNAYIRMSPVKVGIDCVGLGEVRLG